MHSNLTMIVSNDAKGQLDKRIHELESSNNDNHKSKIVKPEKHLYQSLQLFNYVQKAEIRMKK